VVAAVVAVVTGRTALAAVAVAVALVISLIGVSIVGLRWRSWTWSAWDDALELQHGVLTRHASVVPYHRIQQIDVHRGPLQRLLGVSRLVLRTAAATTDATIPGLGEVEADHLRYELLKRAGVDDAV